MTASSASGLEKTQIVVQVAFDMLHPPAGRISGGHGAATFEGWLGLLRVLSDLLSEASGRGSSGETHV